MMRVKVITPPAKAVSLSDARDFFGSSGSDAMLEMLLFAAQADIEPPSSTWGRAFGRQTLDMTFSADEWHCGRLELWYPPVVSISQVSYLDASGASQVLASDLYALDGRSVIRPQGISWPEVACRLAAVTVRYLAGDEDYPEPVRVAIIMSVQQLRGMSRDDLLVKKEVVEGVGSTEWDLSEEAARIVRSNVDRLLGRYRVISSL